MASTGVAVRDARGKVLLTAWQSLRRCGSPEEAEAEACLQGLHLITEWIRQPARVESDCLVLVRALGQDVEPRSSWARIIAEIKATTYLLPACSFKHIHREANQIAHLLEKKALRNRERVVVRHNMPEEVCRQVEIEAAERMETL
jgi:hypothetical protein